MVETLLRRSFFSGVIVPLALLAGQIATLAHSMAVAHDRCPEHGELVHRVAAGPRAMVADGVARGAAGDRGDGLVAITAADRLAPDGHDHCVTLWGRRETIGIPPHPTTAVAPPSPAPAPQIGAPRHGARDELLSVAPKTSPPTSA